MTDQPKIEREAEKRARRICRERGMPEALWQMVLFDAHNEITQEIKQAFEEAGR